MLPYGGRVWKPENGPPVPLPQRRLKSPARAATMHTFDTAPLEQKMVREPPKRLRACDSDFNGVLTRPSNGLIPYPIFLELSHRSRLVGDVFGKGCLNPPPNP